MMKKHILLLSLFSSLMLLISCDNEENYFVGKWQLMSIEDGVSITDCSNENQIRTFYYDGGLDGFEQKATYVFNEQNLYYRFSSGFVHTYNYYFSDNNQTLSIVLTKISNEGDIMIISPKGYQMIGKTQIYKKITK